MPLIEWNSDYEVRIPRVDREHQGLVDVINRLHEAMQKRQTREVIGGLLEDLVRYTKVHFTNEEALLRAKGYPELCEHQREHRFFTDKVATLQADHQAGRLVLGTEVMGFLKDWLLSHILGTDMQFSDYLADRGMA